MCKQRVIQTSNPDFLVCKGVLDAMYRCYTEDKYGDEIHNTVVEAKPYIAQFLNCYFHRNTSLTECMVHFEDSIRSIYRMADTKLTDFH